MSWRLSMLKKSAIAGALLVAGFAAGWLSATILGGRFPAGGDVSALIGPGRGANEATPQELRTQFSVFWEVWNLVENEFYHRQPLDRERMIRGAIGGMLAALDDQYT